MGTSKKVYAAGAVVYRFDDHGDVEVCVIHRPRYDDWSLPKGKLKNGETLSHAAVREVAEETLTHAVLRSPAGKVTYRLDDTGSEIHSQVHGKKSKASKSRKLKKKVTYWHAYAFADLTATSDTVNGSEVMSGKSIEHMPDLLRMRLNTCGKVPEFTADEVDTIAWVSIPEALEILTRDDDCAIVSSFVETVANGSEEPSTLIIVPMHSQEQSDRVGLVEELSAFLPTCVFVPTLDTPTHQACYDTVQPWIEKSGCAVISIDDDSRPARTGKHGKTSTANDTDSHSNSQCETVLYHSISALLSSHHQCALLCLPSEYIPRMSAMLSALANRPKTAEKIRRACTSKQSTQSTRPIALTIQPAGSECLITHVYQVMPHG